jgi:uncharacterized protein (DUF1330 family)
MVAFVDIKDRKRFASEYVPGVIPSLKPFGGRVLAVSDDSKAKEGTVPPSRVVLIEFPELDAAEKWHASDVYAPLIEIRKATADTSMAMFPGGLNTR